VHTFIYTGMDLTEVMTCVRKDPDLDAGAIAGAETSYRNFLWVCWYHWNGGAGSSLAAIDAVADVVWHCHMLRPVEYREDCAQIFGDRRLLDHQPGGDPGPQARQQARSAYEAAGLPAPTNLRAECVWSVVA